MRLVITIDCDNAAFEERGICEESARILMRLGSDLRMGKYPATLESLRRGPIPLVDINGNTAGECHIESDSERFYRNVYGAPRDTIYPPGTK